MRFGGENIGGGRAIKIKERLRGGLKVQRWEGQMRGPVGDDGLVTLVNRWELVETSEVLHWYRGSFLGVDGTGKAYQIRVMIVALRQYKTCTES